MQLPRPEGPAAGSAPNPAKEWVPERFPPMQRSPMTVATSTDLDALVARVSRAQQRYATYTQAQVDEIFRAAAFAATDARIPLAKLAVEETGMGIVEDKVIKNHFSSEYIFNKYKDEKTCGVLEVDDVYGTATIAEPVGLICGIVPPTNPPSR